MPALSQHNPTTLARPPFEPTWALIKRPSGYSGTDREPGKIEQIWDSNYKSLYHRLSPYTDYNTTLIPGFTKEPFYWVWLDETDKGLNALKKYDSRIFPIGSAPIDVIRVAKFLGSGRGIPFLAKQFLLQTGNPYNETRIYNPTSPLIAAGMGLALGGIRPQRFIDTSGGLLGVAQSLIGPAASLFGEPKINPPSGTAGLKALSDPMKSVGGKGLIRAGTAEKGKARLEAAWPATQGGGFTNSFGKVVKNLVKSLFQNFIPQTQSGIEYRSDEGAYGLMVGGGNAKFAFNGRQGDVFEFGQRWIGGGKISRKEGQYPTQARRIFSAPQPGTYWFMPNATISSLPPFDKDIGEIGYTIEESRDPNKPGYRYGDSVGAAKDEAFKSSDIMVQYGYYATSGHAYDYPTKKSDVKSTEAYNAQLQKVIDGLKKVAEGRLYQVEVPSNSKVISSPVRSRDGYNQLFVTTQGQDRAKGLSPMNYPMGVMSNYRSTRVVDQTLKTGENTTVKLPTNGTFDAINTLEVLDKNKTINNFNLSSWPTWEPYNDDLVALYFYDVVNEKYIPFRCAIKGLAEAANASWEEMPFIGRADRVYSYGGFSRNLTFNLKVVISSLAELAPTWQRINYITTAIKPANYTTAQLDQGDTGTGASSNVTNRFMVPPMFMLTIGDLYKDQPVLIQSVTVTIPDDASWETLHDEDTKTSMWTYLAGIIKSPYTLFGQVPREIELGFSLTLLEKERAVVGGANFGHAPRKEDWTKWNDEAAPDGKAPTRFHKNYVVDVIRQEAIKPEKKPTPPPTPPPPATTQPFTLLSKPSPPTFQVPYQAGRTNNVAPPFPSK